MRENEEMRNQEQQSDRRVLRSEKKKELKQIKRENIEYKTTEQAKQKVSKQKKRENAEYKEVEQAQQKRFKRMKRDDENYKAVEQAQQKEFKQIKREDEKYKQVERVQQAEFKQMKREDDEYKETERAQQKGFKQMKRKDDEYKEAERAQQKGFKQMKRKDDEYKATERAQQKNSKQKKRTNDECRKLEQENQKKYKQVKRTDSQYRNDERETQKNYKQRRRTNPNLRGGEKIIDKQTKQLKRLNSSFRQREKEKDKSAKRNLRLNELYSYRERYINTLKKQKDAASKNQLQFLKTRSNTPEHICCSCEGLFFEHSVVNYTTCEKYLTEPNSDFYKNVVNVDIPQKICRTCYSYVKRTKVPRLATSNGLKFPTIPECIKKLSALEERMVAPYINFMQIRALKPFALNPQLSLKGSVVNIAVEVNDMIEVLPRKFDQMATIQIKLKRHVDHATDYMNEVIRPAHVCEALKYLQETPLYKKHNIKIDPEFFKKYENNYDCTIDFIVDSSDIGNCKIKQNEDDETDEDDINSSNELSDDEDNTSDNEVLLIDRNRETAMTACVIAPGQGKMPVPWHSSPDIDELSFPKIFAGYAFNLNLPTKKLSYSDRVKSEARRSDRRSCIPARVLYMAKEKLEKSCLSSVNVCLKKVKKNKNMTAKNVLDKNFIDDLIRHDVGFKVLKQIRSSPSYWEARKKDLLAMIRQLGAPTIFLTLSAAEKRWPELMKCLAKVLTGKNFGIEQALNLNENEKTDFIRQDPVTCARYYDYRISKFMKYLKSKDGPFGSYTIIDSYERVEFQVRGSPHEHIFLWLNAAPTYENTKQSHADCIQFIDKFITCEYDENNPYINIQTHKHTVTCNKGRKNKLKCRFNYPLPAMPRTMILEPMEEDEKSPEMKQDLLKIRKMTQDFFKNPTVMEFSDILAKLNMTENQYIQAVRSSVTRSQVFLQRNSREVGINCYNRSMLNSFEANMDIQFILNAYSCASYIINYISKVDTGLSKLLRETANDMKNGNTSIKERLRKIANVFINSNVMSAQEAAYHILGLPMSKSSRKVTFINTSRKEERVVMLKSDKALRELAEDSNDIAMESIVTKYSNRPDQLEDVCLADYAAIYVAPPKNNDFDDNEDIDSDDDNDTIKQRRKPLVIRYRRYNLDQDPENYYREQVMLFLPWRDEDAQLENANCEAIHHNNIEKILDNKKKYCAMNETELDEALERARNEINNIEEEEIDEFNNARIPKDQEIDIFEQGGEEISKPKDFNRFTKPPMVSENDLFSIMENLNVKQREIVMHILHSVKTDKVPFHIFLNGSAGVGKSTVIKAVYQTLLHFFASKPGEKNDAIEILLCAPSGKAAYLINGVTLHHAFALPVNQYGGQMPDLGMEVANTIRQKLINLKLLIIDEISMVGSRMLSRVDTRLRQIMGKNECFGGISVLVVGDLNQLPPVMDLPIFQRANITSTSILASENLWHEFNYFELTEVMRQQNEKDFIQALNNLAYGQMTHEDIKLIQSRSVKMSDVPDSAIRLYSENIHVDAYNNERINEFPGEEYLSVAQDSIQGKVSDERKIKILDTFKNSKTSDCGGLPYRIRFKIGIKYMITTNLDVEDGLVNGACGILKHVITEPNSLEATKIFIDFQSNTVGRKAQRAFNDYMLAKNIDLNLTPIPKSRISINPSKQINHHAIRHQFPVVIAEALTIHKSQGQTYKEICLDLEKCRRKKKALLYVALSRTTELKGIYIIGKFEPPKSYSKKADPILIELARLKNEKMLTLSYDNLNERTEKSVAFLNVRSLNKHLSKITNDKWYSKNEILIFAETQTISTDMLSIPNFNLIFRSDNFTERRARGIIVFAKIGSDVTVVKHLTEYENKNNCYKSHVDLVCLRFNDISIIAGYKSPSVRNEMFKKNVITAIETVSCYQNTELIVLGDFNVNLLDVGQSLFLKDLMASYDLKPVLPENTFTTNHKSQIDVIFSNIAHSICGTYETYFSDHKPIFICVANQSNESLERNLSNLLSSLEIRESVETRGDDKDDCTISDESNVLMNYNIIETDQVDNDEFFFENVAVTYITEKPRLHNIILSHEDENILLTDGVELNDKHINRFAYLLNSQFDFNHQDAIFNQCPQWIKAIPEGKPNIQLLYSGNIGLKAIGHWICSYYDGNVIHIYDSAHFNELMPSHKRYMKRLYPYNPRIVFHNVQQQLNNTDCGLFAIAFAVSTCFNEDLETVSYDRQNMRDHLLRIFRENTITPFPKI